MTHYQQLKYYECHYCDNFKIHTHVDLSEINLLTEENRSLRKKNEELLFKTRKNVDCQKGDYND